MLDESELSHALLAFHHQRNNWPSAIDYLSALRDEGFLCIGVLFTSPGPATETWIRDTWPHATITSVAAEPLQAANRIANAVRALWGL